MPIHTTHILKSIICALGLSFLPALNSHAHSSDNSDAKNKVVMNNIKDNIFVIQAGGGNIAAVKAKTGWLLIDNDYDKSVNTVKHLLSEQAALEVTWVINTHWHWDHTGGNEFFGKTANIIAHEGVRNRMSQAQEIKLFNANIPAAPNAALPNITFKKEASLHYANHNFRIKHYPAGHTDTDSIIFIGDTGVVHLGDLFFAGAFPFIDVENGGSVKGYLANVTDILESLSEDAIIVPGHGPVSSYKDLQAYANMLKETANIIETYKVQGLNFVQSQAKGLPEKWQSWGQGFINTDTWIKILFNGNGDETNAPKE